MSVIDGTPTNFLHLLGLSLHQLFHSTDEETEAQRGTVDRSGRRCQELLSVDGMPGCSQFGQFQSQPRLLGSFLGFLRASRTGFASRSLRESHASSAGQRRFLKAVRVFKRSLLLRGEKE